MKKIILFFVLVSCTVGPDYQRPIFFEDKEVAQILGLSQNKQVHAPFHLSDFHEAPLTRMLTKTAEQNLDIGQALMRLRQARAFLKKTSVQNLPMVDIEAGYTYVKEPKSMPMLLKEDYYQVGFDVNWELDIFGGGRRQTEQAESSYRGAQEALKNVFVSVQAQLALAYMSLRMVQAQISLLQRNIKTQEDLLHLVQKKYQSGLETKLELEQAKYLLVETKAALPGLKAQEQVEKNTLALLLGNLPNTLNKELASSHNIILEPFLFDVNRVYDASVSLLRNRPDVRVAEEELIGQNAAVGMAVAELFPKVNLSTFLGFQDNKVSSLLNHKSYTYHLLPGVSTPLFHWGVLRQNIILQKEMKEEKLLAYEKALLTAVHEVKNAYVELDQDLKTHDLKHQSLSHLQQVYQLTYDKYTGGLISFSEVLTAFQNLIAGQRELVQATHALYQDLIHIYKALGG